MKDISVKALAKINLGLDVVRKREDGYHEVRMVMQTIHLFDRLEISKNTSGEITMETNLSFLPTNENNLVYKAAKLLQDEFAIKDGVHVWLHKYIPVAAGMAGGSTDAAAVLYGMNQIFDLGLTREELMERGVKIGADVPYCIMRGTALAEGIGEKLSKLPPMVKCPVLIQYDSNMEPVLYYGTIQVKIGSEDNLSQKVVRLSIILPQLDGLSGTLHLETWTPETTDIIWDRAEEQSETEEETTEEPSEEPSADTPAEEQPAQDVPAENTPAEEQQPAENAPAEDMPPVEQ